MSFLWIALALGACGGTPTEKKAAAAPAVSRPTSPDDEPLPPEKTGGFDARRAFNHVEKLVSFGPRPPGSENIRRAQAYLSSELDSYGCAVEEDNFTGSTPLGPIPMKNIIAKVPGSTPRILLLLTHYDTLRKPDFVGANDGGSSTGVMLEMARLLCGTKPSTAIWIAFLDGEEAQVTWTDADSVYGSRQLAARLALSGELREVKAVLLADMIGKRGLALKRESNSTRWLTDLVWSVARRLGYGKQFLDQEITLQDDHIPFVRRGVSAADLIDFDYPPWHTPADTLDKVSARSLGVIGHVLIETLPALENKVR